MKTQSWMLMGLSLLVALLLAACGPGPAAQTGAGRAGAPTVLPTRANPPGALQAQSFEGGNVTVTVTPLALKIGAPLVFDVAMNTHSVDLSGDMLKMVVLRDDAGKEYAPTAWDGAGPGGHHREGKLQFAALTTNARSVALVVKDLAGVPERTFKWDMPQ